MHVFSDLTYFYLYVCSQTEDSRYFTIKVHYGGRFDDSLNNLLGCYFWKVGTPTLPFNIDSSIIVDVFLFSDVNAFNYSSANVMVL